MASKVASARLVTRTGVPCGGRARPPARRGCWLTRRRRRRHPVPARRRRAVEPQALDRLRRQAGGRLLVDGGAARALTSGGKSLLPAGVTAVEGSFGLGETVSVIDDAGREFARGLVAYERRRPAPDPRVAFGGDRGHSRNQGPGRSDPPRRSRAAVTTPSPVESLARAARLAARQVAKASPATRRAGLVAIAGQLRTRAETILAANAEDVAAAAAAGTSGALLDRLRLDARAIASMARAVEDIAAMPDVVGVVTHAETRPSGIEVSRVRIPLGVIAMIYEARPNVTSDAAALCLKAGNACILRGGSEAFRSNQAVGAAVAAGLAEAGLPAAAVQLMPTTDRAQLVELLAQEAWIDLVIPRGGEGLIRFVAEHARIPVLKHYKGVCHVYVHAAADLDVALRVIDNAKVQRPSACNAVETVLIDRAIAPTFVPRLVAWAAERRVELRGDETVRAQAPSVGVATEADWHAEYLDLVCAVRVVDGIAGARSPTSRPTARATPRPSSPPTPPPASCSCATCDSLDRHAQRLDPVRRRRRARASAPRSASRPRACTPTARWAPRA
jgi:glutamate-5-semialdehyde dehydrogenase